MFGSIKARALVCTVLVVLFIGACSLSLADASGKPADAQLAVLHAFMENACSLGVLPKEAASITEKAVVDSSSETSYYYWLTDYNVNGMIMLNYEGEQFADYGLYLFDISADDAQTVSLWHALLSAVRPETTAEEAQATFSKLRENVKLQADGLSFDAVGSLRDLLLRYSASASEASLYLTIAPKGSPAHSRTEPDTEDVYVISNFQDACEKLGVTAKGAELPAFQHEASEEYETVFCYNLIRPMDFYIMYTPDGLREYSLMLQLGEAEGELPLSDLFREMLLCTIPGMESEQTTALVDELNANLIVYEEDYVSMASKDIDGYTLRLTSGLSEATYTFSIIELP